MVLSQSIDVIYIGRILFEELVSDAYLFGTVVEGKCYARFTLPLYYLPYLGIELPTSLRY